MPDRSLEVACRECGRSLTLEEREALPVRCEPCFEEYLRGIDLDFLASYGELGVTSRRTVAETCLRSLVLEQPPTRKVLAVAIMEQFLLASGDLIGLHYALKGRHRQPIVRAFLSFQLDGEASGVFFAGKEGDGPYLTRLADAIDETSRWLEVRAGPGGGPALCVWFFA